MFTDLFRFKYCSLTKSKTKIENTSLTLLPFFAILPLRTRHR
jgi:hypothetical protein